MDDQNEDNQNSSKRKKIIVVVLLLSAFAILTAILIWFSRSGGRFVILGGGDVVFPLMLVVSMVDQRDVLGAAVVALFAVLGFALSFHIFVSQKTRKPIPALPAIAFTSIIGYLLSKFF